MIVYSYNIIFTYSMDSEKKLKIITFTGKTYEFEYIPIMTVD